MKITIPIDVRVKITKKFEYAHKKSIEYGIKHITKTIKNHIPTNSGNTKESLNYSIDYEKGEARIGWKQNSKEELVGSVLQYGSGQRGKTQYQTSRFGETKPDYTVPIVPTRAKAMTFMGNDGQRKFMKEFKGHPPKYILTRGLVDSMKFLTVVIDENLEK